MCDTDKIILYATKLYVTELCGQVVCHRVVCGNVVCERAAWDRVLCDNAVCDSVCVCVFFMCTHGHGIQHSPFHTDMHLLVNLD